MDKRKIGNDGHLFKKIFKIKGYQTLFSKSVERFYNKHYSENKMKTDIAKSHCWCGFCNKTIHKTERFLKLTKSAWKGETRMNICIVCLTKINNEIEEEDYKFVATKLEEQRLKDTEKEI